MGLGQSAPAQIEDVIRGLKKETATRATAHNKEQKIINTYIYIYAIDSNVCMYLSHMYVFVISYYLHLVRCIKRAWPHVAGKKVH